MGEKSKNVGDQGEELVKGFLQKIGWSPVADGFDIECEFSQQHKGKGSSSPRSTHGIDLAFTYPCPLVPELRRNILISVKNSSEDDTKNRSSTVKSDIIDLGTALKCFKRSPERREMNSAGEGAIRSEDYGILFKLNKDPDNTKSFLGESGGRERVDLEGWDPIYLIENARYDFVDRVMAYAAAMAGSVKPSFVLTKTSLNVAADQRKSSSPLLPIQNLIGGPIAMRLDPAGTSIQGEPSLALFSNETFDLECFRRLASLAYELSSNWVQVLIVFPDFQEVKHGPLVKQALVGLAQKDFAKRVQCASLNAVTRLN
ncbi:hypothetical protein [Verrucomicrobium spinosum]|uniref:hypothetical protein n=1 Tax=Verrucomicrobium spinosum TaxID=2736 RepID=UPI00017465AB|nr:hypothetical protein [Verrucomicrobium spinosum]